MITCTPFELPERDTTATRQAEVPVPLPAAPGVARKQGTPLFEQLKREHDMQDIADPPVRGRHARPDTGEAVAETEDRQLPMAA
jgi:hypothetical protein